VIQVKKVINVTPHALNVIKADGSMTTIAPSGQVARLAVTTKVVGDVDGISVYQTEFGEIQGLPAPEAGTVFIGSLLVAQAAAKQGRADVLSPGELIRDKEGKPIGCKGLTRQG